MLKDLTLLFKEKIMKRNYTIEELKSAHQDLILQHNELLKCTDDLKIANKSLDKGEIDKANLIIGVNHNLAEMIFNVSHKIRKSVANILGIADLLRTDKSLTKKDLNEMLDIIIESAKSLNISTTELSKFIHNKKISL
jgi:signal transduction histidine kinase